MQIIFQQELNRLKSFCFEDILIKTTPAKYPPSCGRQCRKTPLYFLFSGAEIVTVWPTGISSGSRIPRPFEDLSVISISSAASSPPGFRQLIVAESAAETRGSRRFSWCFLEVQFGRGRPGKNTSRTASTTKARADANLSFTYSIMLGFLPVDNGTFRLWGSGSNGTENSDKDWGPRGALLLTLPFSVDSRFGASWVASNCDPSAPLTLRTDLLQKPPLSPSPSDGLGAVATA